MRVQSKSQLQLSKLLLNRTGNVPDLSQELRQEDRESQVLGSQWHHPSLCLCPHKAFSPGAEDHRH